MLKKVLLALAITTVTTVNADCLDRITSCGGTLDLKIKELDSFANIAVGRGNGRPGIVSQPIKIASEKFCPSLTCDNDPTRPGILSNNGGICPTLICSDGKRPA
ncbi:hypothetical protein [Spartinivicinus poritis]|uniref:Uncharacterized protein n=1 Tax=Spartinivicinus poritis TaxID=2994640 RepID=A0ABT5U340_9GAMM|nr:hypothetical protein [Spartinivicinus sp. A2-2]MDE1460774.1 hypothetical protein [Spartinivicinus sp. A2-2]